jgi:hypothetical protein
MQETAYARSILLDKEPRTIGQDLRLVQDLCEELTAVREELEKRLAGIVQEGPAVDLDNIWNRRTKPTEDTLQLSMQIWQCKLEKERRLLQDLLQRLPLQVQDKG